MKRFGHELLPDNLNSSEVRLENVRTLKLPFHANFVELKILFAAIVRLS